MRTQLRLAIWAQKLITLRQLLSMMKLIAPTSTLKRRKRRRRTRQVLLKTTFDKLLNTLLIPTYAYIYE
ncbi:hypothetical protein LINPERPRIM_LOCUS7628 [Linum perenne]